MDFEFKLNKPCKDCPFKKSTQLHYGVMQSLPEYKTNIEKNIFAHSCHQTDSRSDGFNESYKGEIQHCAGALIMLKKMNKKINNNYPQVLIRAMIDGLDIDKMNDKDVYNSFDEMVDAYKPLIESRIFDLKYLE